MFDYNICNQADKDIFDKQCHALEKHIPNLSKGNCIVDVDGSSTQFYFIDDKEISVHYSLYIGAVFIKSEIEIEPFFI